MKKSKELRLESKKKKIKAFLEIAKLNEDDRKMIGTAKRNEERFKEAEETHSNVGAEISEGPKQKKQKLNVNESSNEDTTNPNPNVGNTLRPEDLAELRKLLKERYIAIKNTPLLRLKSPVGEDAQLSVEPSKRVPLFLSDLQHFLLYSLLVRASPCSPRWCVIDRAISISSINMLFIENVGMSDFLLSKDELPSLSSLEFPFQLEVLMSSAYDGNLIQEFCAVPLSLQQYRRAVYQHGSLEAAAKQFDVFKVLRAIFPVEDESKKIDDEKRSEIERNTSNILHSNEKDSEHTLPASDKFPRTQLLLSAWQMLDEGYPMPINGQSTKNYKDFVPTKHLYKEVSDNSPMYGIDCEMCITTSKENECTRVSIVNEKLETVLDTLVMPYNTITNYLTNFSGITRTMMEGVTTRLEDVQKFIQENIEPDAIFVGQSLNFDLIALKMFHPYVIDTSIIFNITGDRYRKSKLRLLTQTFLKEDIQSQSDGHCSVEDSSASLKLVQLKLSNSIDFGDIILQGCKTEKGSEVKVLDTGSFKDRAGFAQSVFNYTSNNSVNSCIVGVPEVIEKYVDYLNPKVTKYMQDDGSGNCATITQNESESSAEAALISGCVTCAITNNHNSVAAVMAKKMSENKLCIGHIRFDDEESSLLASGHADLVNRLNGWVEEIHAAVPVNGVFMVVLCGQKKSSNGICFVSIKKRPIKSVKKCFSPVDSNNTQ